MQILFAISCPIRIFRGVWRAAKTTTNVTAALGASDARMLLGRRSPFEPTHAAPRWLTVGTTALTDSTGLAPPAVRPRRAEGQIPIDVGDFRTARTRPVPRTLISKDRRPDVAASHVATVTSTICVTHLFHAVRRCRRPRVAAHPSAVGGLPTIEYSRALVHTSNCMLTTLTSR